jgi:hypothetical protein
MVSQSSTRALQSLRGLYGQGNGMAEVKVERHGGGDNNKSVGYFSRHSHLA